MPTRRVPECVNLLGKRGRGGSPHGNGAKDSPAVCKTSFWIRAARHPSHEHGRPIRAVPFAIANRQGRHLSLVRGLCGTAYFESDARRFGFARNRLQSAIGPRDFLTLGAGKRTTGEFPLFRGRSELHSIHSG